MVNEFLTTETNNKETGAMYGIAKLTLPITLIISNKLTAHVKKIHSNAASFAMLITK